MVVMVFMTVVAAIPLTSIKSEAAYSPSTTIGQSTLTSDELTAYIEGVDYLTAKFETAEEMLANDLKLGYLDSSTSANKMFTIYVNRYTGFLYYKNNLTGQILTSNPTDPGYKELKDSRYDVMSQISVEFFQTSNPENRDVYNSVKWAALYGQIRVAPIAGGLRVNYTLGDTSTRFLLPAVITAEDFTENILVPMIENFETKFAEALPSQAEDLKFLGSETYDTRESLGYISFETSIQDYNNIVSRVVRNHAELYNILADIVVFSKAYTLVDPNDYVSDKDKKALENCGPFNAGEPVMRIDLDPDILLPNKQREYANVIKKYCPDYTLTSMFADEKKCGYTHKTNVLPYVRCAIEYSFADDGSLNVRVPANSISFDETTYTLDSITPLKFFGYGNMQDDGFMFFPDGSGTIIEFDDFYNPDIGKNTNVSVRADSIFGVDYCYSDITGAHREQISVPVYGLVSTSKVNASTKDDLLEKGVTVGDTVKTGYFAILEEGASLARLNAQSLLSSYKYGSIYASYNPYPKDEYDLSQTLTVGSASKYTMTAKTKYSGSYVTRITMLYDNVVGNAFYGSGNYCETSYVGMAAYYRNYLKDSGVLKALETITEDIPLYVEVLGSMTKMTKVLTFPVEEEIPLTTFDDVITMYNEFASAKKTLKALIEENKKKADETLYDVHLKNQYLETAAKYEDILDKIQNIKNVNFRLTGFANDGMYYTYPNRASWQSVLGGDRAFQNLVNEGKRISKIDGQTFGIYPEFDFLYISNTSLGDGISQNKVGARMVDNRYASKQIYNAIIQEFETFYTMLVSSDVLDSLYEKFNKDYSRYGAAGLSVSTLGSDVNSNFDKDNSINRDEAREDIVALLRKMNVEDGYDLMVDKGNIYSVKYASHILNISTDSSHFKYSSYAIPFIGMILHGYVQYAGSALNYSGSANYEVLRSIESGASPYYVLCYDNAAFMKDDEKLNKYYGVDYRTWYDDILVTYTELNAQLSDLQNYEIIDHKTVIVERTKEESEKRNDYAKLQAEFFEQLRAYIDTVVDAKFNELKAENNIDARVKVVFEASKIEAQFRMIAYNADLIFNKESYSKAYGEIEQYYTAKFSGDSENAENDSIVEIDEIVGYESKYSFATTSDGLDEDYTKTAYTLDNNKVVIVTYSNGEKTVRFILNYNIYTVDVRIDGVIYTLDKYEYVRIDG